MHLTFLKFKWTFSRKIFHGAVNLNRVNKISVVKIQGWLQCFDYQNISKYIVHSKAGNI